MAPLPSIIMSLQGIVCILNGLASLLSSSVAATNMELLSISLPAIHSIALASASIGTLYLFAAKKNDRAAMWSTVVGRAAAVLVFWGHGGPWRNVAVYEGVCGGMVVVALGWEAWSGWEGGKSEKAKST